MNTAFHERFVHELQDLSDAEQQIVTALPAMIEAVSNEELRAALEDHLEETKVQIERLDQVFRSIGETPKQKACDGMRGLIKEGEKLLKEGLPPDVLDAAVIAACQKIEHYEIAGYGTLATWAEQMGHEEACELLGETLGEEEDADETLTEIAESMVNEDADDGKE